MDQDPGDDLAVALTRYLAEHRVDAAAAARARERWLRQVASEEMVLAGVLLDLAERGEVVAVQVGGGRVHRGRIRGVGEDFAYLATGAGDVLVRHDAVVSLRSDGVAVTGSDRAHVLDLTLVEALAVVAGDRPRVLVVGRDGTVVAGDLRTVGRDVLVLRLADADGATVYVPLGSVVEVALPHG